MTTEIVEGEIREIDDETPSQHRALAVVVEQPAALTHSHFTGMAALASMSDEAFEAGIRSMKLELARVERIQRELLIDGTDYGTVQGVKRPFLHKPGAEKLAKFAGYAITFRIDRLAGDGIRLPPLAFVAHADVHIGDSTGPVVAAGEGEANSWETKYRWRMGGRVCPECGQATIIEIKPKQPEIDKAAAEGKEPPKARWWCAPREGGCRKGFTHDDERITSQSGGRVENADPYDLANTLVKMAKKRAFVDGVLTATGTSGLFTQDEDSPLAAGGVPGEGRGRASSAQPPAGEDDRILELGRYEAVGAIAIGTAASSDGLVHQGESGSSLGFKLDTGGGRGIPSVVAAGAIAEQLAAKGTGKQLEGIRVTVAGDLFDLPFFVDGRVARRYQQLRLTAIWTDDWRIPTLGFDELEFLEGGAPAPSPDPTAAAPVAADAPSAAAPDAVGVTGDPEPVGPARDLTLPQFKDALEANRIGEDYALALMKRDHPKVGSFADLNDDERGQLLAAALA